MSNKMDNYGCFYSKWIMKIVVRRDSREIVHSGDELTNSGKFKFLQE